MTETTLELETTHYWNCVCDKGGHNPHHILSYPHYVGIMSCHLENYRNSTILIPFDSYTYDFSKQSFFFNEFNNFKTI